jgi:hypothetical protein
MVWVILLLRVVLALAATGWALICGYVGYVRLYFGVIDWWNVYLLLLIPGTGLAALFGIIFARTWGAFLVAIQAGALLLSPVCLVGLRTTS